MAKAVNMIGTLKGKVGNVVYATVRGETIARVYQPTVANPRTARQELSRAKMALAVELARSLMPVVRVGFNGIARGREFQQAVKAAIPVGNQVITGNTPASVTPNYGSLGEMMSANQFFNQLEISNVDAETAGRLRMSLAFPANANLDPNTGAEVPTFGIVVVYQTDTRDVIVWPVTYQPTAQTVEVPIPEYLSGLRGHVYAFYKQVPEGINGITTATLPYRIPGRTSRAVYGGTFDFA